ncbi:hypothetical protein EV363DRAFT_1254472 [Boletus edulis]|nr:hypothetical protein EV363DRAFT_1254472 [Boletus edulis]
MHRCLNIVEVLRAIFREVHHQSRGSATLARLARTCRAFNGVALDVLWATLDSFVYLIQCLPRDLWKIEPADRKLTFQRPMSLRDWEIFFRYSSRIRNLFQSVGPEILTQCSSLGDDVIFALSNPPTYGPLIPYLRKLYWDKPNRKYASLLRLLLTPSLVTLSLSFCTLRSPEVSILTSIGTVCPSLKTLCITSHRSYANILDAKGEKILSEALLYLHSLESLSCPALDEAAIVHLSHLPFLADLSMELQLDFQLEKVWPYIAPPAFASINSLMLHANALSMLTSLLEPMRFKPTTVAFVVASTPTPDALRLFFLALASACGSERLSRVSLTTCSERQRGAPPQQVTLSTFQSLLAFPNIHAFEFDVPCDVALDDNAITMLTKHWSGLAILSINAKSGWGITSRVTHQGLMTLLSRCPTLTEFALAIDFSDIDGPHVEMPESRPGEGVANTKCLIANFVTSAIMFPITIAAFLSDVCPEVEAVKSEWHHGILWTEVDLDEVDTYRERWEEVENLLPAFSAVRKQCMEWAQKKAKEESVVPA